MANLLFFWKDESIRVYKTRHRVLEIILAILSSQSKDGNIPPDIAVSLETVAKWSGNAQDNMRAIRFLLSTGYLKHHDQNNISGALMTQKGTDAFNSEYFLSIYKEQIRLRNNNRWMILFNGVVAFGVIYSIWNSDAKVSSSPKEQSVQKVSLVVPVQDSVKTPSNQYRPIYVSWEQ